MIGFSLLVTNCSDDDNGTNPDPKNVTYYNTNITSYTYNEYDLDESNNEKSETRHQDSLSFVQETTKDGKTAWEYDVYTNAEGTYESDGKEYYAGEKNKLYAHLSVFQKMFANIESNGFSLETLFDQAGDWFLIADAEASSSWVLFDGSATFNLPVTLGETDADIKVTMASSTKENLVIEGESKSVDKYSFVANIKASTSLGDIDQDVRGAFWVAENIGVVKSNINSFTISAGILELDIEGNERILVNHTISVEEEAGKQEN